MKVNTVMDEKINESCGIREMPEELRPREKMQRTGIATLSDSELMAILLRTGNGRLNAIELATVILVKFKNLKNIANATIEELSTINGIGLAKASQIKAAFELGRRMSMYNAMDKPKILTSDDAANLLMETYRIKREEHLGVILLDSKSKLIKHEVIHIGSLDTTMAKAPEIFRSAITGLAKSIILFHNHPSGDPTPSEADVETTYQLVHAGSIIGINIVDHIIIGDGNFISLKNKGYL
jgi:DNA repair protein RadC